MENEGQEWGSEIFQETKGVEFEKSAGGVTSYNLENSVANYEALI